jgi:uroporphyrinogen decarboxylase
VYEEFGMDYVSRICDAIDEVPITVFSKGAYYAREAMSKLNCNTIGLDWNMNVKESREIIGHNKTLQGNLDPCVLFGSHDFVKNETNKMLESFDNNRHIVNLGHGVYPDTDPEKVKTFINTVKEFKLN